MFCIPTPNHRGLVDGCYPPGKKLAGSENPDSNALGKLVYYAQAKPAKLTKVGKVLQERATSYAKSVSAKGEAGQDKNRCGLMITLSILKSLVTDCRRDVTYIAGSTQSILQSAIDASLRVGARGRRDLELSARASSTFFAFASALDPSNLDTDLGEGYLSLLRGFGQMAVEGQGGDGAGSGDQEDQNRMRLIGLGALSGAMSSEAFFTPSFPRQVDVLLPPLLGNIQASSLPLESLESEAQKTLAGTPSFSEFVSASKKRPGHRKAPSLSGHIAGEKGPDRNQVVSASMGILQGLFKHADASQLQDTMKPLFKWMDGRGGSSQWANEDWACFLIKTLSRWTSLQYRYVLLTCLVEYLVEHCDGPAQAKHATLLAMITEVLQDKGLTLIGLSTSDALNNLAALVVRRVHFDSKDPLLPQMVETIESLATHVYYADEIVDIAEELVARIVALAEPNANAAEVARTTLRREDESKSNKSSEEQKMESIRILLFALTRVIVVANEGQGQGGDQAQNGLEHGGTPQKGKAVASTLGVSASGNRTRVQPQVLQPTVALLASSDAAVRLAEGQLLLTYLLREVSGPTPASSTEAATLMHGVSAAAYVAALSPSLRLDTDASFTSSSGNPLDSLLTLDRNDSTVSAAHATEAAVPVDYACLAEIFTESSARLGAAALLAIVPALFGIDRSAASKLVPDSKSPPIIAQRRRASRILLARVWASIGKQWDISQADSEASTVLSALADELPAVPAPHQGLNLPEESELFPEAGVRGEGSGAASEAFSRSSLVKALSSSQTVQDATGLSSDALRAWFERDWNVSIAVDDSAIGASPYASEAGAEQQSATTGPRIQLHTVGQGRSLSSAAVRSASVRGQTSGVKDFRQALSGAGTGITGDRSHQVDAGLDGDSELDAPPLSPFNKVNGGGAGRQSMDVGGHPISAAERRASKRASRGVQHLPLDNQQSESAGGGGGGIGSYLGFGGGATGGNESATSLPRSASNRGVGSILDSLGIPNADQQKPLSLGVNGEQQEKPTLVPPHAA